MAVGVTDEQTESEVTSATTSHAPGATRQRDTDATGTPHETTPSRTPDTPHTHGPTPATTTRRSAPDDRQDHGPTTTATTPHLTTPSRTPDTPHTHGPTPATTARGSARPAGPALAEAAPPIAHPATVPPGDPAVPETAPAPGRPARSGRDGRAGRWRPDPPGFALALVALAYALTQLVLVVPHLAHVLGWDETVYVSQLDPRHPAAFFSAPRSRGISLLVAPIVMVSGSVPVLRIALALLSAAALYAAYRTWGPLLGPAVTALGALFFSGLWITQISGPEAMPNLWVALGAVAAVGWFLRAPRDPYARWWMAACLAGVALMRAPDAAWLALPLLVTAACVRSHRRTLPFLLGGLVAGGAEWVVEAYVRFGGVPQRLHVSGATEGGMHPHLNFLNAWRSLNGPELCRPCEGPVHHPELTLWWPALPALVAVALIVALRDRGGPRERTLLPLVTALSLSVPYLLLLSYSAPRFLLPMYALLALPLAGLLVRVARVRPSLKATVCCVVVLQLAVQFAVLTHMSVKVAAVGRRYRTAADDLRALGVRAPCTVAGPRALPVAYDGGCASAQTSGNNRSTTVASLLERTEREPVAVLTSDGERPPHYARDWTRHALPGTRGWVAWLAPYPRP